MKRYTLLFISVFLICATVVAQGSFSIQIDGAAYPFKKALAGAEKIMNNETVGITFSDAQRSCILDFDYKKIDGKNSVALSSEMDNTTYKKGFNITYKPNLSNKEVWNTASTPVSRLTISDFNQKTISGTFEAVIIQIMDADGKFSAGKSSKTITIKGEFKNLPFTKVN